MVHADGGRMLDVYATNLEDAFEELRIIVQDYPYIGMDTEFPGVVARPLGEFRSQQCFQYQQMKCNVNLLKLIQLGFTFFDKDGNLPEKGHVTFQFNFKFDRHSEMFAQDSLNLLEKSGIQFNQLGSNGIPHMQFAELLTSSGILCMDNVVILSFHSQYDFGYLLRMVRGVHVPDMEHEFIELLQIFFPTIYDIKYLMKSCKSLSGGLEDVAKHMEIQRIGQQHQAGSDSRLTGEAFFRMQELFFEGSLEPDRHGGRLFGISAAYKTSNGIAEAASDTYQSSREQQKD